MLLPMAHPPHVNPPDDVLRTLLSEARTIAVVGASPDAVRPSHGVMIRLLRAGYHVIPVNPQASTVLGRTAYPSLREIGERIDIVDVFRRPEFAPAIADEAVAIGARALWLQEGIVNDDAARRAIAGGLTVVMDACIAVAVARLGVSASVGERPPR
jgi:predicted CoA-binding protein